MSKVFYYHSSNRRYELWKSFTACNSNPDKTVAVENIAISDFLDYFHANNFRDQI
jgi:hypothetical protein